MRRAADASRQKSGCRSVTRWFIPATSVLAMLLVVGAPVQPADEAKPPPEKKPPTHGLVAELKAARTRFRAGQFTEMTVTLRNRGKRTVTLVRPGDGSRWGHRTPLVGWSIRKTGDLRSHLTQPVPGRFSGCGNVNPLKKDEVRELPPGASMRLETWLSPPRFKKPGTYRVVFLYQNDPTIKWRGLPLGKHDAETMARVRRSKPCLVASNEIRLTVLPVSWKRSRRRPGR